MLATSTKKMESHVLFFGFLLALVAISECGRKAQVAGFRNFVDIKKLFRIEKDDEESQWKADKVNDLNAKATNLGLYEVLEVRRKRTLWDPCLQKNTHANWVFRDGDLVAWHPCKRPPLIQDPQ